MSSSVQGTSNVDYSNISKYVTVHGVKESSRRNRQDTARWIDQANRVTDNHGFDLTIETREDGTRRIIRGEDPLGSFYDRNRLRTLARAATTDESGRPLWLPERELTDYEAGRRHLQACGITNCDHPVHFPGGDDGMVGGKITFEEGKQQEKEEGEGDSS